MARGVTQKNMDDAEAGMRKTIEIRELPRLKNNLIGTVRGSLPHPETAQFRDVHMNTAHNAACGEVDFEYWPNGSPVRSGYQKFIIEWRTIATAPMTPMRVPASRTTQQWTSTIRADARNITNCGRRSIAP